MKDGGNAAISNAQRWSHAILLNEISDLRREHAHLMTKRRERELNSWEQSRLDSILSELRSATNQLKILDRQ